MARYPFQRGPWPLTDELCLSTSKFLSSLFSLMDDTFGEEYNSELYLMYVSLSNLTPRPLFTGTFEILEICVKLVHWLSSSLPIAFSTRHQMRYEDIAGRRSIRF